MEQRECLPTSVCEARLALLKIASTVARRWRRRDLSEANRQDPTAEPESIIGSDAEKQTLAALEVLELLEQLEEPARGVLIANKVLGYSAAEIGRYLGLSEAVVAKQIWRAVADASKKKREREDSRRAALAALAMPGPLAFAPETKAAMLAILSAEGRVPAWIGGPGGPPPFPPIKPTPKFFALAPLAFFTPQIVAFVVLGLLALGAGLGLAWGLLARTDERPHLALRGLFISPLALESSCPTSATSTPPSAPTNTPQPVSTARNLPPPLLDTTALEALRRTVFPPGKTDRIEKLEDVEKVDR